MHINARLIGSLVAYQPLTPAVFHVLLALADGDKHGYAIMKSVEEHTSGTLKMGAGTLYGTLQRLTDAGWVLEVTPPQATTVRDERRRFYRLTGEGRHALGAEVKRLEDLVRLARRSRGVPKTVRH
jgi:DNA-binding PadR family transcriptional regulator